MIEAEGTHFMTEDGPQVVTHTLQSSEIRNAEPTSNRDNYLCRQQKNRGCEGLSS